MEPDDELPPSSGWKVAGLAGLPGVLRWMARATRSTTWATRFMLGSWVGWALVVGLLYAEYYLIVLHPSGWALIAALGLASAATLSSLLVGVLGVIRGPRRAISLVRAALGLAPVVILSAILAEGVTQFRRGHVEATLPFILFAMGGTSLGELAVDWTYPHRIETETLIMSYGDGLEDPSADVAAMEAHIGRLHAMTRHGSRGRTHWVRGKVFGQQYLSMAGLALGSDRSPLSPVDLHEVGHAVLYQRLTPDANPPMLFAEGWAEAVSHRSLDLARAALSIREHIERHRKLSDAERAQAAPGWDDAEGYRRLMKRIPEDGPIRLLRELTAPEWYHRDRGIIYPIGGAFQDYVIRKFSPEKAAMLFLASQPGNLDFLFDNLFQKTPEQVEDAFWRDLEWIVVEDSP